MVAGGVRFAGGVHAIKVDVGGVFACAVLPAGVNPRSVLSGLEPVDAHEEYAAGASP